MNSMVIFILDDINYCHDILNAWEDVGVFGVTMLDSSGLGRVRNAVLDDLPLMPSLSDIFKKSETQHRTFFTVVDSEEQIDAIVKATESVIGSLDEPNTGFLFTLPVGRVYGRSKRAEN
jgi:nitrogen regulatory protein P-II 1